MNDKDIKTIIVSMNEALGSCEFHAPPSVRESIIRMLDAVEKLARLDYLLGCRRELNDLTSAIEIYKPDKVKMGNLRTVLACFFLIEEARATPENAEPKSPDELPPVEPSPEKVESEQLDEEHLKQFLESIPNSRNHGN